MEQEKLLNWDAVECDMGLLDEYEIMLFDGSADYWAVCVMCAQCGEDMYVEDAYNDYRSFNNKTMCLCRLCNAYNGFHNQSDKARSR